MSKLILVRHGESRWNIANKFSGWVDVPLSEVGVLEAQMAAEKLQKIKLDMAFTSKLSRAQSTLLIILSTQESTGIFIHEDYKNKEWQSRSNIYGKTEIPIFVSEKLNERYYGIIQGMDKGLAKKKHGENKVLAWRRTFQAKPPKGESLKDTYNRVVKYFNKQIMPQVRKKKNILISSHGNTLRAIIKYIEKISDQEIPLLELPTGEPIIYNYSRSKLTREDYSFSFDRPVYWEGPKKKKG